MSIEYESISQSENPHNISPEKQKIILDVFQSIGIPEETIRKEYFEDDYYIQQGYEKSRHDYIKDDFINQKIKFHHQLTEFITKCFNGFDEGKKSKFRPLFSSVVKLLMRSKTDPFYGNSFKEPLYYQTLEDLQEFQANFKEIQKTCSQDLGLEFSTLGVSSQDVSKRIRLEVSYVVILLVAQSSILIDTHLKRGLSKSIYIASIVTLTLALLLGILFLAFKRIHNAWKYLQILLLLWSFALSIWAFVEKDNVSGAVGLSGSLLMIFIQILLYSRRRKSSPSQQQYQLQEA